MPDASTDLGDTIANAATTPSSASSDGQSVSARPVNEIIEADRYLRAKESAAKKHRGLRFAKIVPPGAV